MARPKKNTVDYFPHTVKHKKTIAILEDKFGNDGYAFWFKLLEMLGEAENHYLDLNDDMLWEYLQSRMKLDAGKCTEILGLLAKLDAIDAELWEEKVVWCQNLVNNVADVYRKRSTDQPSRPVSKNTKPEFNHFSQH